jgi:PPP family 3-phenylpropionic acid transporter
LRARGFGHGQVGLLLGVLRVAGILGPLLIGRMADRTCRYRLILQLCLAASVLFMVPLQYISSAWAFVPFLLIVGAGNASLIPLSDAFANRELPDPTHRYGQIRLFGSLGFIACSLALQLARLIDSSSSLSILLNYAALAAIYLGALFFLPACTTPTADGSSGDRDRHFARPFWFGMGIIFLGSFTMTGVNSFLSLFIQEGLGWKNVSLMAAIAAVAEAPLFFFSGRLIHRWGLRSMFLVSLAAMVVRLLLYALVPVLWAVVAAQLLHSLTFGLFQATTVQFVNRHVPRSRVALGMTVANTMGWGLSSLVGSMIGGYLIESFGFSVFHVLYALPAAAGFVLLLTGEKRMRSADPLEVDALRKPGEQGVQLRR